MLTGLKVSSFPCKCVFYRPEHNAKRNLILKVLKCKNEAHQQIELKELMKQNGVICLVAMFTPGVTIIKMSKMAHFLYFLLMATKNQAQFGQKKNHVHPTGLTEQISTLESTFLKEFRYFLLT